MDCLLTDSDLEVPSPGQNYMHSLPESFSVLLRSIPYEGSSPCQVCNTHNARGIGDGQAWYQIHSLGCHGCPSPPENASEVGAAAGPCTDGILSWDHNTERLAASCERWAHDGFGQSVQYSNNLYQQGRDGNIILLLTYVSRRWLDNLNFVRAVCINQSTYWVA
jgi:hypothetical protein